MPKLVRHSALANANLEYLDQATLADPQLTSEEDRKRLLELVLRSNAHLISAMKGIRSLQLPDWCISGPSIAWPLWTALKGNPAMAGNHQLYITYYDPSEQALEKEATYLRHIRQVLSAGPYQVHLSNQAGHVIHHDSERMSNGTPVTCTAEALVRDPVQTYALGVRLEVNGSFTVLAPFGLSGVFSMKMERNTGYCDEEYFLYKLRRVEAMWPDVALR
ncbi:nucleotidyltransferase family protein [Pseudovibrio ascidiaceicola]|uniref:nucleotidyltransferase family protein n=1 Tax=Pseudovibrio ascidiaceicola TaxID=285279 RepID=UPI003D3692D6